MYICRIKIQPYEDTVLYLSDLHRFAYFISVDHPHGNLTIVGSLLGGAHILGILSGEDLVHN